MTVKVGRTEFSKEALSTMSLEKAIKTFGKHSEEKVEKAWIMVNGKPKVKKKTTKK